MEEFEDPWGEEPDWALDGGGNDNDGEEDEEGGIGADDERRAYGAQHLLILVDASPSMFVPCIRVRDNIDHDDDDDDDDEKDNQDGSASQTPRLHFSLQSEDTPKRSGSGARTPTRITEEFITPFDASLMACERIMRHRVRYVASTRQGKRDGVGIMLYGKIRRQQQSNNEAERKRGRTKKEDGLEVGRQEDADDDVEQDGYYEDRRYLHGGGAEAPAATNMSSSSTYQLLPIEPPGIEHIKSVRNCLPGDFDRPNRRRKKHADERQRDLQTELGLDKEAESDDDDHPSSLTAESQRSIRHSTLSPLREALFQSSKAFLNAKCVKKTTASSVRKSETVDTLTVWIFTNNDDPCHGDEEERKHLQTAAEDATENGLDLDLCPLPQSASSKQDVLFDRSLFFDSILRREQQQDFERVWSLTAEKQGGAVDFFLDELLVYVAHQASKSRRAMTLPLLMPNFREDPTHPGIMLDLYRTLQVRRRPQPVTVHQEKNKATIRTTQTFNETGEIVRPEHILHFAEFGGEQVPITKDEVATMKQQSLANDEFASLVLLGFKPNSETTVPLVHTVERAYVAYATDGIVQGSSNAFAGLFDAMVRKGVVGLGELLLRITSTSRLVAIIPEMEKSETSSGERRSFLIVPLPYEDEIRNVDADEELDEADEETVAALEAIIALQKVDHEEDFRITETYENPALQKFWNYVEAVALDIQIQNKDVDDTTMQVDEILQVAGNEIDAFHRLLPVDPISSSSSSSTGTQSVRKRSGIVRDENGDIEWNQLYENDTIGDCNKEELKSFLRSVGQKVGGSKRDLIERIQSVFAAKEEQH